MSAKNMLGIIFSSSFDEALPQLTALRTMGSVPFGGRYRLIDFQLSDMVNAGITKVGVLTNANYRSLMDHIGNGKPWDLARKREGLTILPPFSSPDSGFFKGKVDALYGSISYISKSDKEYVLLSDCNVVSAFDYDEMLKFGLDKDADIVVAYKNGNAPQLDKITQLYLNNESRIIRTEYIDCYSENTIFSLNTMIFRRTLLERLLHEAHSQGVTDFETIIMNNTQHLKIYGYEQKNYTAVIDSLIAYYNANIALLSPQSRKEIFRKEMPVYTKTSDRVPTFYGIDAKVANSLIADGCKIEGEVENSILFRGVTVAKGAKVKNSIIMQGAYISENCSLNCIITDKSVVFKPNKALSGADNYPIYVGKGIVI